MDIGTRIRILRENADLTQLVLAKNLKISNSTLSMYERGERIPSDDIKIAIADYFNVSIDYLLGRTDQQEKPTPVSGDGQVGPAKQALLDMMDDMDEDELIALAEMVKAARKIRMRNTE